MLWDMSLSIHDEFNVDGFTQIYNLIIKRVPGIEENSTLCGYENHKYENICILGRKTQNEKHVFSQG